MPDRRRRRPCPRVRSRTGLAVAGRRLALVAAVAIATACAPAVDRDAVPDVLLVTIDTLRADHVGAYGHARPTTPVIDALAAGGGLFEVAYAPMGATSPSHATLMTSLLPPAHGVVRNGFALADEHETLAEHFAGAGYCTAAFVSSHPVRARFGFAQGFAHFDEAFTPEDSTVTFKGWEGMPVQGGFDRRAEPTTDAATAWLEARDDACPLFVWVHYFDPHAPYAAPEPARRFGAEAVGPRARMLAAYDDEIRYADAQLGRLIEAFDAQRPRRPRITVVTSDHGEGLRDHGHLTHNRLLYDSEVRVPLVVHAPGRVAAGTRSPQPAHLVDVAPTLAALAGVAAPGLAGVDLSPWLGASPPPPDTGRALLLQRPHYADAAEDDPRSEARFGARVGRWKWIGGGRSAPDELYDLDADPGEVDDRAAREAAVAAGLARRAGALAESSAARRRAPAEPRLDDEDRRALEALGYLEPGD